MTLYIIHQSASTIEEPESLIIPSSDGTFMLTLFDEIMSLDSEMYMINKFPFIQLTALNLPHGVDEELTLAAYDEDMDRLRKIIADDFNGYEYSVLKEWGYGSSGELDNSLTYDLDIPSELPPYVEISDDGSIFTETVEFLID